METAVSAEAMAAIRGHYLNILQSHNTDCIHFAGSLGADQYCALHLQLCSVSKQ
jgi:hypothetical protein